MVHHCFSAWKLRLNCVPQFQTEPDDMISWGISSSVILILYINNQYIYINKIYINFFHQWLQAFVGAQVAVGMLSLRSRSKHRGARLPGKWTMAGKSPNFLWSFTCDNHINSGFSIIFHDFPTNHGTDEMSWGFSVCSNELNLPMTRRTRIGSGILTSGFRSSQPPKTIRGFFWKATPFSEDWNFHEFSWSSEKMGCFYMFLHIQVTLIKTPNIQNWNLGRRFQWFHTGRGFTTGLGLEAENGTGFFPNWEQIHRENWWILIKNSTKV